MSLKMGLDRTGRQATDRGNRGIGFHWFPDDRHLRLELIERFLPHLERMGVGWLVLKAPLRPLEEGAAIAARLRAVGVEPLLHLMPAPSMEPEQVRRAAESWVQGGARVIAIDNRPNSAGRWPRWEPTDLPRRYARWLTPRIGALAELEGVTPLFPPLAPGGEFWDSTFLAEALAELQALAPPWLDRLGLACINDLAGRPLTWGEGGPARWGDSTRGQPPDQEDQIGFRGWEWAAQVGQRVLGRPVATYALESRLSPGRSAAARAAEVRGIRRSLATLPHGPALGAAFWLLAEEPWGAKRAEAWFLADGTPLQPASISALTEPLPAASPAPELPTTVRVLLEGGRVQVMALEEYLGGVLPAEMGAGAPLEALKAQAVAARCQAIRAVMAPRHHAEGADLCTTEHCQRWRADHHPRADQAIRETAGQVALYEGRVINAFYSASCGGSTRDGADLWRAPLPYCRPVACPVKGEPASGHGAGMCQRGAMRMAQQGASFEDILRYYYVGIEVRALQPALPAAQPLPAPASRPTIRIERREGRRAVAGTLPRGAQPITILDPWGNRYDTVSGSRPEIGTNGWEVPVPVDGLYRVQWPGHQVEVAVQSDRVILQAA